MILMHVVVVWETSACCASHLQSVARYNEAGNQSRCYLLLSEFIARRVKYAINRAAVPMTALKRKEAKASAVSRDTRKGS